MYVLCNSEYYSMNPRLLVIADRYPILPEYSPSTWMLGSLRELSAVADVDVVSVINILPRLKNLFYPGRDRVWLKAVMRLPKKHIQNTLYSIEHARAIGTPARLSWKMLPELLKWQLASKICYRYRSEHYNAVFIHGTYPMGKLGVEVARRFDVPLIVVNHEGYQRYLDNFSERAAHELAIVLSAANLVITLSPNHQKEIEKYFPNKITSIVPHGITVFPLQKREQHHELRVLTASRLEGREKRNDILLEGFAQFYHNGHPDACLTFAGDGAELNTLHRLSKKLNISEAVQFTGWISGEQLKKLYQSHDVFVCASSHETFCYAALEAIASGLPVIGLPTVGILSEFVSLFPEETALSELTSSHIAEKLAIFYNAKNKWQLIANAMVQVVKERFTWDMHRNSLQNVMNQLIQIQSS
jgi:glycosyltransferase involved in cell wall biosynthesis